jgi:hypothetical protein
MLASPSDSPLSSRYEHHIRQLPAFQHTADDPKIVDGLAARLSCLLKLVSIFQVGQVKEIEPLKVDLPTDQRSPNPEMRLLRRSAES